MNEFLQIIGSVASIGSIPLAIYLFLKSQAQKYARVRADIVERLASQLGEGRRLSVFEIQSVIDSKSRLDRIKQSAIHPDEVIQDLVAETINSRLLESGRKEEIIQCLQGLHSQAVLFVLIGNDNEILKEFSVFLSSSIEGPELQKVKDAVEKDVKTTRKAGSIVDVFGSLAAITSFIAVVTSLIDFKSTIPILPKLLNSELLTSLLLGIVASLVAAVIALVIRKRK
ncbi:MAG: hypothetical protein P1P84_07270 [Deferrisomatales bacterium]|nr:hypothetical protein [Deferrisomatales bacterium]